MGLIQAGINAVGGALADQWKEYFYCEALPADILVSKGAKRTGKRDGNSKGTDNIISDGSVIAVNDGQCMIIVDQGRIAEFCAVPGEFVYDTSTEPSIFSGNLGETIPQFLKTIGARFAFGGAPGKDQRIYFFNTKEIIGNKFGTPNPVPFRVVDTNVGLDVDISIRCHGEYSYRITNPVLFYVNVCGNVERDYSREEIDSQLKTEMMTALQPAFAKISDMGIRYSALPGHATELANALNTVLSAKWGELRGISIVSVGVNSVKASDEDEAMIKELQRNAAFKNPQMAAAHLVGAQATAMQDAAKNTNAGPVMAFAGMNMAAGAGGANAQNLYGMAAQQQPQAPAAEGWACPCGKTGNSGAFCSECGKPKPGPANSWTCECGTANQGKFCQQCGKPKPAGAPLYRCDKCGWQPQDPTHPPKFCPECGDVFDEADAQKS